MREDNVMQSKTLTQEEALNEYLKEIIEITIALDVRQLPKKDRENARNKHKRELKGLIETLSTEKKIHTAKRGISFLEQEYKKGNISPEMYKAIRKDLDACDKRLENSMKLQAKKGSAQNLNTNTTNDEKPKKPKRNIKMGRVAMALIVAGAITAGTIRTGYSIYQDIKEKKEMEAIKQEEKAKNMEIQEAKRVLADSEKSVYVMAQKAIDDAKYQDNSSKKGMELLDEVKDLYRIQYEEATGEKLSKISIIEEEIVIGRDSETGRIVHAERNLPNYIANGYDISTGNRYMIFRGDAYSEDGKYNQENFIAECTDEGEIFTDSNAISSKGTEILTKMAKSHGADCVVQNGNTINSKSMLESAVDFKRSMNYSVNRYDLGDIMAEFYSQYSQFCEEEGIDFKQDYANKYITNRDGERIACVTKERTPEQQTIIDEAVKTIEDCKKELNKIKNKEGIQVSLDEDGWEL